MTDISELKNIGNTSAHWLQTVGISSYEQLKEVGAVDSYLRVKAKGIKTSIVLLYALQGALLNVHWNDLEPDMKKQLSDEAAEKEANAS